MYRNSEPSRVLYLDGGLPMQQLIACVLQQRGCTVQLASNIWQALDLIKRQVPDLILLNISDFATEISVIKRIKVTLDEVGQSCPMLAIATFPCPKVMARARRYGVTHTLEGDIKADALATTVELILAEPGSDNPGDGIASGRTGFVSFR